MKITRRNFIAAAPVAVSVMTQLGGVTFGATNPATDRLALLTSATFLPYVGTDFTFRGLDGNVVRLTLISLEIRTPLNYVSTGRGEECFALKFSGPTRQPLEQDVYTVDHFALRSFSLFITENGGLQGSRSYEAVFNRLTH